MGEEMKTHVIYIILIIVGYFLITRIIQPSVDISQYENVISDKENQIDSLLLRVKELDALLSISNDSIIALNNNITEVKGELDKIPGKYDQERVNILRLTNDESVKYLSDRLNRRIP